MAKPWLWLLAGPDGSGKSTLASSEVFVRMTRTPESPAAPAFLSPDTVAAALRQAADHLPAVMTLQLPQKLSTVSGPAWRKRVSGGVLDMREAPGMLVILYPAGYP